MNEQKQDLLAFLRELQGVIEGYRANIVAHPGKLFISTGSDYNEEVAIWCDISNGESPELAEAIERLESEITPQGETPDEDGTSYL